MSDPTALTWALRAIRQTPSGESGAPGQTWQTLSAESVPASPTSGEILAWQDAAWMLRLRRELASSHLLELSRASDPLARAFYEVQALARWWSVRELRRQRDSMLFERIGLSSDRRALQSVGTFHRRIFGGMPQLLVLEVSRLLGSWAVDLPNSALRRSRRPSRTLVSDQQPNFRLI